MTIQVTDIALRGTYITAMPAMLLVTGPTDILRPAAERGLAVTTTPEILPAHTVHLGQRHSSNVFDGTPLTTYRVDHTRHTPGSPLAAAHARIAERHRTRDRYARLAEDTPLLDPADLHALLTATADAITDHPDTPIAQADPRAIQALAGGTYGQPEFGPSLEPGPVDPAEVARAYAVVAAAARVDTQVGPAAQARLDAATEGKDKAFRAWIDSARVHFPKPWDTDWDMQDVHTAEWVSEDVGRFAAAHDHAEYDLHLAAVSARRAWLTPRDLSNHVRAVSRDLDLPIDATTHALAAALTARAALG